MPPPQTSGIYFSDSLLVGFLARLRWGTLAAGEEIFVGSVFVAAWLGQLATCLNLFPVGQLDGGHLLYSVVARRHRILSRVARWSFATFLVALIFLPGAGIMAATPWLLWLVLLFAVGERHPPVLGGGEGSERGGRHPRASRWRLAHCQRPLVTSAGNR